MTKKYLIADSLSYIVILIGIVALSLIIYALSSEGFTNRIKELFGNYIYPEQLKPFCGLGTIPQGQKCVPDNTMIIDTLIEQSFINIVDGKIIFTPDYDPEIKLPAVPDWYNEWTDRGTYSCQRLIREGVCNIPGNNCNAPCRCGDCAGWRGGNLSDCNNIDIGGGRVFCNLEPGEPYTYGGEEDSCECAYGYCAVNGLCVSPFEMNGNRNNNRCCPECAWISPDKQGGCAGSVKCNPNLTCTESIVELPGYQYKFDSNHNDVTIIKNLCSNSSEVGDCYHPENIDARRRQPYVKVTPGVGQNLTTVIGEPVDTANGQNEYDCAVNCGDVKQDSEFSGTIKSTTGLSHRLITVQCNTEFSANDIQNGDFVKIDGVTGNTAANGRWVVESVQYGIEGSFRLKDSSSNGDYISGGTFNREQKYKTVGSQVECSKRCLPKLWRWYPIFEEKNNELNYTGGYYQSDELMRYLPSDVDLKICPSQTCETEMPSGEFTDFHNCTDCQDCKYEYSDFPNGRGFYNSKYDCKKCNQCLLTQPSDLDPNIEISCNDMTDCNTCMNALQSTVIRGVNYNECDTCLTPEAGNDKAGCKAYTRDPYIITPGNSAEFHEDAKIYNHGADPNITYTGNSITQGYNPGSRDSDCDYGIVTGNMTCDNTKNGKKGWGDGFFYSVGDCTKNCH